MKLNLTVNPSYNENNDATTMGHLDKEIKSKFICPISMKEMNGKHRFVYLDTCGCVFAEQSLKEVKSKECMTVSNNGFTNYWEGTHTHMHELEILSVAHHLSRKISL